MVMGRDGVAALPAFACRVLLIIFVQLKSLFPKVCKGAGGKPKEPIHGQVLQQKDVGFSL